jgi:hypothetical protein
VFPLTTAEADTDLTAERTVTWDFSLETDAQWGATVTDDYTLTNPTDEDITVTALYPFAGSLSELSKLSPTVTVDGAETETTLYAGSYAGGFQNAGVDNGSTWNLDDFTSWTDYQSLLADGSYLSQALGDGATLDQTVTMYEFSDFVAPFDQYDAATQAVTFTIDQEKTTVLTYGFNGSSWDKDTGWRQYDYFVPNGVRRGTDPILLVVLGEDIGEYTLTGYANGACEQEIDGVSCTVTRSVNTLAAVLERLCVSYYNKYVEDRASMGFDDASQNDVPVALLCRAAADLLTRYGLLSEDGMMDRYSDGRLDDIISESLVQRRMLYVALPVTVPAGGSVSLIFNMWKEPSFDFDCTGSENVGLQGYDLVTSLGSTLAFTSQTAALTNTDHIEIVRENFGFDLENGVTTAQLDLNEEHYSLEIRPKE